MSEKTEGKEKNGTKTLQKSFFAPLLGWKALFEKPVTIRVPKEQREGCTEVQRISHKRLGKVHRLWHMFSDLPNRCDNDGRSTRYETRIRNETTASNDRLR